MTSAAFTQQLVAFFELEGEVPSTRVQPRIRTRQAGFFPVAWLDIKGPRGIRETLVTPLIIEGWADLVFVTQFRDGPALQALNHDLRFGLGIPFSSLHG